MGLSWSLGQFVPVLRRLPGELGRVAITIDDAPTPETMPAMLDLFDRHQAKATFFLSGCRAENQLELVAETVRRGHAVYAHGWEHIRLDKAGPQRLVADMERCEALLARFRPTPRPYLVRLPYNGGYRSPRVHRALARWQQGCQIAHWDLSTEDHMISVRCQSPAEVEQECRREVERLAAEPRLDGAIVLMHDQPINERPGAQFKAAVTITLTRLLLEAVTARNLRAVTLEPASEAPFWSRFVMP